MVRFEVVDNNIKRLTVPFEDVYTTVFLISSGGKNILFDTATYDSDAENYIIPALKAEGISPDIIFLSHGHRDHAGGLDVLCKQYPSARVYSLSTKIADRIGTGRAVSPKDGEYVASSLTVVHIPGHASDAMGLFDERTSTLISGDCLQVDGLFGNGEWGANITAPTAHIAALDKLRKMGIERILAAHDYSPFGWRAEGKAEVLRYIDGCEKSLYSIRDLMLSYLQLADEPIAEIYNTSSGKPRVNVRVFASIREELC